MTQQDIEQQENEWQNFGLQDFEQQDAVPKPKESVKERFVVITCLSLGGLFLLAWPMVLIVSIVAMAFPFVPVILIYPWVYIPCLLKSIAMFRNPSKFNSGRFYHRASFWARLPVYYVFLFIALPIGCIAFIILMI